MNLYRFACGTQGYLMRLTKSVIVAMALISTALLTSCEDAEDRKLASAQKCLNGVGDRTGVDLSNYAQMCMDKIAGMDNVQANNIFCAGYFLKGGLTNSKIITAFDLYNDAAEADKEAVLIENLSLGVGGTAVADSNSAYTYCSKTGVAGLIYVASLCRIGTFVDQAAGATIDDQIQDFIDNASAGDQTAVGEMIDDLSEVYCQGEAKESNLCIEINSAKQAAGTNYEQLAEILLAQFL
jgi:hypothetical protein